MEFKGDVWVGDIDLKVINIWMCYMLWIGWYKLFRENVYIEKRVEEKLRVLRYWEGYLDVEGKSKDRCYKSLENCFKKEGVVNCVISYWKIELNEDWYYFLNY